MSWLSAAALSACVFLLFSPIRLGAQLPAGAQVVRGDVAIAQAGNAMTIQQASRNAIVNWRTFDIGAANRVRLAQVGADAALLARVTGGGASALLGSLQADGKLFLINPRGIVIGRDATIDTAAFTASTLDVADRDFLAGGALTFKGDSAAGIVNLGRITAREGNVRLFAHTVENAGAIVASQGAVTLGAGTEVFVAADDAAAFEIKLNLPGTAEQAGVKNSGVIEAAQAELKAAGGSIYEMAINQSGVIRAHGVETRNGRVLLTADGGTVGVSGRVEAHNADGGGGEILVGGDYRGGNADVPNAGHTVVTADAQLDASATTAGGHAGRVVVWSDEGTRFLGTLDAKGNDGGFAEVSGARFLDFRPARAVDLGTGGSLLLDPSNLVVSNAADASVISTAGNPFVFGLDASAQAGTTLNVATLQTQLQSTNVTLDASAGGRIFIDAPIAWSNAHTLRLNAGDSITISADITAASGRLELFSGLYATLNPGHDGPDLMPNTRSDFGTAIAVNTLVVGANAASHSPIHTVQTPAHTGTAIFEGNLNVGTLTADLSGGAIGVQVEGGDNTIGTFNTSGTGDLRGASVVNHHGALDVNLAATGTTTSPIRIATPGTLTLLAGTALDFAAETDVILASTGGAFVNNATLGANVFGANGRYLIYSSTPGATVKGGLGGVNVFNHAYDEADSFPDSTRRFFFSAASGLPVLNYAASNKSKTYGDANPAFGFTVTGADPSHPVATSVTGAPRLTTTAGSESGVGTYAIAIGLGSLFSNDYDFSFTPATLTVTAAPLYIFANDASRHLGRANPAFTASFSGFVNGDTSSVVSGLRFSTPATSASPEGNYAITPSGASAANYSISYFDGTLSIAGLAELTIAADSFSRSYGSANPTFTAHITGFEDGEGDAVVRGLQFATQAQQSSGVGAYAITPFGATAPNYAISYQPGTLTIERAPLTISAPRLSRTYGDANPELIPTFSGFVNGDTAAVVGGLKLSTAASNASNVGNYPVTVEGGSAANYAISYVPGSLQVTKASATIRADDKTRFYGDPNPTLTYTVTGLRNGDGPEALGTITQFLTLANERDQIGLYGIFLDGFANSPNYDTKFVSGSLTIKQRPLTITAPSFSREYYDLDPISSPDLVDAAMKADPRYAPTFTGLAPFDTPAAIPNVKLTTQATLNSGASTFGILVSSDLNRNYAISYRFGSLTITPRPLYFRVDDFTRTYGTANPDFLPHYDRGLAPADTLTGLGLQVDPAILSARNVGTYAVNYHLTNPNYQLFDADLSTPFYNSPLASQLKITPAPLRVAVGANGRFYGDANPALDVQVFGLAFGESANDVLTIANPTGATTPVGRYDYSVALKGATPNYTIAENRSGMFQINPRLLTVAVDLAARYYGDANPTFTATFGGNGFAPFDAASAILGGFQTAVTTNATTEVGLYRIDPVFKTNPNYIVSWKPGYLAILPRPIELVVNNGIAFGNNNIPADFSVGDSGLDLVRYSNAGTTGHTVTATNLPAGVTFRDVAPDLYFQLSSTNDPSAVSSTLTPAQFLAQFKPPATTPTDPVPPGTSVPPPGTETAIFTPGSLPEPTVPAAATPIVIPDVIVVGTLPVLNPTADQKKSERFADGKAFILPRAYGNKNYAVTKITNGVLTMKADPVVVSATLTAEEAKRKRDAAKDAFFGTTSGDQIIVRQNAYGFSTDMNILIFQALGLAIDQDFKNGNVGADSITQIIKAGAKSEHDLTGDDMLMWLADFHTNPAKQALLMPIMMNYAMTIAYQDPAKWSAPQAKLMEQMKPFIAEGRKEFVDSAKAAQADWNTAHESAGGMVGGIAGLYGLEVTPYEKFVGAAVESTVAKAVTGLDDKFKAKTGGMTQQELAGYIGVAAGGGSGAVIGTVVGSLTATNLMKILPNTAKDIKIAAEAIGKTVKAGTKAAEEAATTAARGARAVATMETLSNTIAGPAEIISFAIEAAITQGMRAGEEDKQKDSFSALLNSTSGAVDPHAMMQTDIGRAEMMLGLMTMFGGG